MVKQFEMGTLDCLHSAKRALEKAIEVYTASEKTKVVTDSQMKELALQVRIARCDMYAALSVAQNY
jgi:hypothetical protein